MTDGKPVPEPSADTTRFWEACDEERLVVQECTACGKRRFYPAAVCPACGHTEWTEVECSGRGTVRSHSTVHRPPSDAFADDVPYVVALVELDEGPMVMANVLDCDPGEVTTGAPVALTWESRGDRTLFQFVLADA